MTPGHNKFHNGIHYFTLWEVVILHNKVTEGSNIKTPNHNITTGSHSATGVEHFTTSMYTYYIILYK